MLNFRVTITKGINLINYNSHTYKVDDEKIHITSKINDI